MENLLSVVVVSSYSPVHPSTKMTESVINSLKNVSGIERCKVYIILDGYSINNQRYSSKKGIITDEMASDYIDYCTSLSLLYADSDHIIVTERCTKHHGFAMAVKKGISLCKTTYALVCQHDRKFTSKFHHIDTVINEFERNKDMRYVGFSTVTLSSYLQVLNTRYRLNVLSEKDMQIELENNCTLQPLIYWYDSQHICHIERYLEVYQPYTYMPPDLKATIKELGQDVGSFRLRYGDFIEDRFGQAQRNLIVAANKHYNPTALCHHDEDNIEIVVDTVTSIYKLIDAVRWFGCYLLLQRDPSTGTFVTNTLVGHLKGRQTNLKKANYWRARSGVGIIDINVSVSSDGNNIFRKFDMIESCNSKSVGDTGDIEDEYDDGVVK